MQKQKEKREDAETEKVEKACEELSGQRERMREKNDVR